MVASSQLPTQKEVHHFASTGLVPQPRRSEAEENCSSSNQAIRSSSNNSNNSSMPPPTSTSMSMDIDMRGKSFKKRMYSREELEQNKYSYSKIHCSESNAAASAPIPRPPPPPIYFTQLQYVEDPQLSESSTAVAKAVLKKTWRVHNLGPYPWPQCIMFAFTAGDRLEFLSNASWAAVNPGDFLGDRYFSVHLRGEPIVVPTLSNPSPFRSA